MKRVMTIFLAITLNSIKPSPPQGKASLHKSLSFTQTTRTAFCLFSTAQVQLLSEREAAKALLWTHHLKLKNTQLLPLLRVEREEGRRDGVEG